MKASSVLKKVACVIFGASLMYAFTRAPKQKDVVVRTERTLVPVPMPPEKSLDAERVRAVFDSRETTGARCTDAYGSKGVAEVSPTWRVVSASFLDRVLEQQAELMRGARIVPVSHDGRVTGVNLYGVKPGTLTQLLGFENGDELRDVNGFDFADPDRALEAYARLRTADVLSAGIVRKGVAMRLYYVIC